MLAYVAPLWFASVACLIVAVVGLPVKLAGSELPGITRKATRIAVGGIGVFAFVLGLALYYQGSSTGPNDTANNPAPSTSRDPVGGSRPAPSEPVQSTPASPPSSPTSTATEPPASTRPPDPEPSQPAMTTFTRLRWRGTLTMNALGPEGYLLDEVPPSTAIPGMEDLAIGSSANEVVGRAVVGWESGRTPTFQRCSDLVTTNLGLHRADVRTGSGACFSTKEGRVGFFTVADSRPQSGLEPARLTLAVTIWERVTAPAS